MAVDEALLHSAAAGGAPCLRFYAWSEPTLSLGYFQAAADRQTHPPSAAAPLVRRSTGGGAILHDRELTYSLTCYAPSRSAEASRHYYLALHETAIMLLGEYGIRAHLAVPGEPSAGAEPFLCFLRRADGDLLVGDRKVLGSAQRRYRGGLLQHGSLLLDTSPAAPELAGLQVLADLALDSRVLAVRWAELVADRLGLDLRPSELLPEERELARQIEAAKFRDKGWTERR